MRIAFAFHLSLILVSLGAAADSAVVEVPRGKPAEWHEFNVEVGRPILLDAKQPAKWGLMDDVEADLIPVEMGAKAVVSSPKAGRVKIAVAVGDDLVRIVVVVGGAKPPGPPSPKPADPLVVELATLYATEPAATRKADMQSLSALYTLMIEECQSPAYTTAESLNGRFIEARDSMLSDPKKKDGPRLPTIRKRCGAEVAAVIGNGDLILTKASRDALAAVYERLAKAVELAAR